ncbi:penicillin-binding transpeptidase domain-containing protein [Bacillus weihaiensis]|uniref:penicillin-binding transpeptidase domain-containing protein n=1 Tax=Bacillus weihaiensis TaxID=1547283 RepID=UPI002353F18A|nr:penicillin-binding transpeptidase domain-containing protein [Bacillus weihaiensis]
MRKTYLLVVCLLSFIFLWGCSTKPTASERLSEYIQLWNDQKFSDMYSMLSLSTKSEVTEEEFVSKYKNIYEGISARELEVTFIQPDEDGKEKDEEQTYSFTLSMNTIAGNISFDEKVRVVKEKQADEEEWFMEWSPSMIFPHLEAGQEVKVSTIPAVRGQIFDQNEKGLAVNGVAYEIGIMPGDLPENQDETLEEISTLLDISVEEIKGKLNQAWVKPELFVPIKKIDPTNVELYEKLMKIPSVLKQDVESRVYPLGEAAAHLTGYIGNISAEQLEQLKDKGYNATSMIGKAGLEQVYEDRLKGEEGAIISIKDTDEIIAEKEPTNGEDITLTINRDIQQAIYDQLKGDMGTSVALHPLTGETLALVSSPSYNPNDFILGISSEAYNGLVNDPKKPMMARFNKTYSPGSTIKPLTAAIGLNTSTITPNDTKIIKGKTWKKDESWGNYSITRVSDRVENVNLESALVFSDNIYFAQLALDLGKDQFSQGLKSFGYDEDIDYPFPMNKSTISNNGLTSETLLADSGYGQGELQMSPFHVAAAYTTFLNEGNMVKPFLEVNTDFTEATYWKENILENEQVDIIAQDLKQVIEHPNGTGHSPVLEGIQLAGKTGTAELKQSKEDATGSENGWFVAYNTENPSLLIAMMVEEVKKGEGSHYVVPKVKGVFEAFGGNVR